MCQNKLSNQNGFSLVELMYIVVIGTLLLSITILLVKPNELRARARDNTRLSDLASLERAISEYALSNESFPGDSDVLLASTSLPQGSTPPLENASGGWIGGNLSPFLVKLPIDPLNNASYYYSYRYVGARFEINAILENLTEYAVNDGGNSSTLYEVGNDLTIL